MHTCYRAKRAPGLYRTTGTTTAVKINRHLVETHKIRNKGLRFNKVQHEGNITRAVKINRHLVETHKIRNKGFRFNKVQHEGNITI